MHLSASGAPVIFTSEWLWDSHDAKLTLYHLTLTLILCQLNQGFPRRACRVMCICFVYKSDRVWISRLTLKENSTTTPPHPTPLHPRPLAVSKASWSWCAPGAPWTDGVRRFLSTLWYYCIIHNRACHCVALHYSSSALNSVAQSLAWQPGVFAIRARSDVAASCGLSKWL